MITTLRQLNTLARSLSLAGAVGLFQGRASLAATIDFEQVAGVASQECLSVSNQFQPHFGVSFRLIDDRDPGRQTGVWPLIARVGHPPIAFGRNRGIAGDTPAGSNAVIFGNHFLTTKIASDGSAFSANLALVLDFDSPVSSVSGQILDLDGNEVIVVTAFADKTGTNWLERSVFDEHAGG
ncbi:MAG TPA: hypothetical protein VNO52_18730, partial [Methylomirabilota bacterium]|nr:hypothetical protein [Methylomirabilota bacterium]